MNPNSLDRRKEGRRGRRLGVEALEDRRLLAGTLELVHDVNTQTRDAPISQLISMGDVGYFQVDLGTRREVWRTDGTSNGSEPVLDFAANWYDFHPVRETNVLAVVAEGAPNGDDFGAVFLVEPGESALRVRPESVSHWRPNLVGSWDGRLLVGNHPDDATSELWALDVPSREWRMIWSSESNGIRLWWTGIGATASSLVLHLSVEGEGAQVWKSDGTQAGTRAVSSVLPELTTFGFSGQSSFQFNGDFFFDASGRSMRGWWRVPDGAEEIEPFDWQSKTVHEFKDELYFGFENAEGGYGLYRTVDGSFDQYALVKEIPRPPQGYLISSFFELDELLYFLGPSPENRRTLWRTDGTNEGTFSVSNLNPSRSLARGQYGASEFVVIDGDLFFTASSSLGDELWKFDPDTGSHGLFKDIREGSLGSSPGDAVSVAGGMLFTANDGAHGFETWYSDGTVAGTHLVLDLDARSQHAYPGNFTPVGDRLFFLARDATTDYDLWVTDGTSDGTHKVSKDAPQSMYPLGDSIVYGSGEVWWITAGDAPERFLPGMTIDDVTSFGDFLYFAGDDGVHGLEPWVSDGTPEGTRMAANLARLGSHSQPEQFVQVDDQIFFLANINRDLRVLWRTDGTEEGTVRATPSEMGTITEFEVQGDSIWAATGYNSRRRWFRNTGGLTQPWQEALIDESSLVALLDGRWIEMREDDELGREPWTTDGTEAGTRLLRDFSPGAASTTMQRHYNPQAKGVYFSVFANWDEPANRGDELWYSNIQGGEFVKVAEVAPYRWRSFVIGDVTFFPLENGLMRSDGTPEGTSVIAQFPLYVAEGLHGPIMAYMNGSFFFHSFEPTFGRELWKWTPIPGDADIDGDVDLRDFQILKSSFGAVGLGEAADFNRDERVDLADFNLLKSNFASASAASLAGDATIWPEETVWAAAVDSALRGDEDDDLFRL